jgi:acetyl/propionyl-CoA carboxylase alpha subunit
VIAHAGTREEARARLVAALAAFDILGVRHNVGFLRRLLDHPDVVAGHVHTRFIDEQLAALTTPPAAVRVRAAAAAAAAHRLGRTEGTESCANLIDPWDAFATRGETRDA